MFKKSNFLYLIILFSITISCCYAHNTCSSLQLSSPISQETLYELSKGCIIELHDKFTMELPLIEVSELQTTSQLHLDLSNDQESFHINLLPTLIKDSYDLEVIFPQTRQTYSLSTSNQAVMLAVNGGIYTVSFKNSSIKLSDKLQGDFPYILSIQLPHQDLIKKEESKRFLYQCSEASFLVDGICKRTCPAKQFGHDGVCSRCPDKCYTGRCISEKYCNPCNSSQVFFKETNTCVDTCPESYFEDYNNKICVKCMDGCRSCAFPDGKCSASYFKTDMIINLIVSTVLLGLITLCACCCNKEKPEAAKTQTQEQQAEQAVQQNAQAKATSDHLKNAVGIDPKAPYVVLPEAFDFDDEGEGEGSDQDGERRKKKRLTEYAKSKLLSISLHKKGFMIDDADEEKAISHGSATLLSSKVGSISCLTSKTNSPLFKSKRRDSRNAPQSSFAHGQDKRSHHNIDETMTPQPHSYGEIASPYSVGSGLVAKKETSLGLMAVKKKESVDATSFLETLGEDHADIKVDVQFLRPPLELPELDKTPDTVHEAEEREEIEEVDEEEVNEKEGYKCDFSINASKDTEETVDFNACTICSMNKRDCLNRPCGHMVACYACMEQFKENYGVCPRCKKQLLGIEKIDLNKNSS